LQFENSMERLRKCSNDRVDERNELSDRDKVNIIDLFVNNDEVLRVIKEAIFGGTCPREEKGNGGYF